MEVYVCVWLGVGVICGAIGGAIGSSRGRAAAGTIVGLLFGPLGLIVAALLPPTIAAEAARRRELARIEEQEREARDRYERARRGATSQRGG